MAKKTDCWAEWVATMRPSPETAPSDGRPHPHVVWRERVLDGGEPIANCTLLDVGCGEGLIGFGALERGAAKAIFSDISENLLDFCRRAAAEKGSLERSRFVQAPANDLSQLDDASVDVVTTRSVLIYVADKRAAFGEFARVLRPDGRVSLFEPINRFARRTGAFWAGFDLSAIPEIEAKIRAVYDAVQPPDTDPMFDFDERDLLAFAEDAGFFPIQLVLEAEILPKDPMPWETFLGRAGNPRIPTIADAMEQALTPHEREQLTAHLKPLVEEGRGTWRSAMAFLRAVKA